MPKIINYNNKYYPNADWAATKTEAEFVAHEKESGLSEAELKEAYALCKVAVAPVEDSKPPKNK
jgi:hypothetical protein